MDCNIHYAHVNCLCITITVPILHLVPYLSNNKNLLKTKLLIPTTLSRNISRFWRADKLVIRVKGFTTTRQVYCQSGKEHVIDCGGAVCFIGKVNLMWYSL
jgi:hypothetical protein